MLGIPVYNKTLRYRHGPWAKVVGKSRHIGNREFKITLSCGLGILYLFDYICCRNGKYNLTVYEVRYYAVVVYALSVYGEELIELLIDLHAADRISVVDVDKIDIVTILAAYIHVVTDKKVVVENICYIPLKDSLYLLGSVIALSKLKYVGNGKRKRICP